MYNNTSTDKNIVAYYNQYLGPSECVALCNAYTKIVQTPNNYINSIDVCEGRGYMQGSI